MPLSKAKVSFFRNDDGPLAIWSFPEKGMKYTIGVDAATGVGADWTVFQVITNCLPFEQVAMYRARINVVDAGDILNRLGRYYNTAELVIETNHPGNAVQDAMIVTHGYPRCYLQEKLLKMGGEITKTWGFKTTEASKWQLIRETHAVLRHDELFLNCPITIEEMCNFVYVEDRSKTGASEGLHDDTVMALMLAVHGASRNIQTVRPKQEPNDDPRNEEQAQHRKMFDNLMQSIVTPKSGRIL